MASLANCIKKAGLTPLETKMLMASFKTYRDEGYSAKESARGAIQDKIAEIEAERVDILRQVGEKVGPAPEAKPTGDDLPFSLQPTREGGSLDAEKEASNVLHRNQERAASGLSGASVAGQRLSDVLAAAGYVQDSAEAVAATGEKYDQIREVAKSFGLDVVFFKASEGSNLKSSNGFTHRTVHPDTIFLNSETPNPYLVVAGHETLHSMRNNAPELYQFLADTLRSDTVGFNEYLARLNISREQAGVGGVGRETGYEEFLADFAGQQFADKAFWEKLHGENPSFARRILDAVKAVIDKIKSVVSGGKQFFSDVDRAQTVLAEVMAEYQRRGGVVEPQFKPVDTSSPAFKKWFGDSKVVDENGEPLRVYRGGQGDVYDFNNVTATNVHTQMLGIPTYFFASNKVVAGTYGDTVGEYYLNLKDPLIIDANGKEWVDILRDVQDKVVVRDTEESAALAKRQKELGKKYGEFDFDELTEQEKAEVSKLARDADAAILDGRAIKLKEPWKNHDGIIIRSVLDIGGANNIEDVAIGSYNPYSDVYVVFSPNQIKSSITNTGEFSESNPDIRYSTTETRKAKNDLHKETLTIIERAGALLKSAGVKQHKTDLRIWDLILKAPQFFKEKILAVRLIFGSTQDRQDDFHNGVFGMENHDDVNALKTWRVLKKPDRRAPTDYLLKGDRTGEGFGVRLVDGKWQVLNPLGQAVEHFESNLNEKDLSDPGEIRAVAKMLELERESLSDQFTPEQVEAVRAFRISTNKGFDLLIRGMRKLQAMEKAGKIKLPEIDAFEDGKKIKITIAEAMARMGDLRGTYFPRIRKPSGHALLATKEGEYGKREHANLFSLKMRKAELEKQGWTVEIVKNERLGEDVFEMAGRLVATQQMIDAALEKAENNTEVEGLQGDIDKIFASALAEQLANVIRERGARAHMTSRSETVWTGYEEDPETALAKYIRGLSASEAKRTMIGKMLRALTGTSISFEEFEEAVKFEGDYDSFMAEADLEHPEAMTAEVFRAINDPAGYRESQNAIVDLEAMLADADEATQARLKPDLKERKGWLHAKYGEHVREQMINQRKQPRAFRWAKTYIDEQTRNQEAVDRVVGNLRGLAVCKYLAFRVFAAPLVNLTALPTSTIATLKGAGIPYRKTWGLLTAGIRDYGLFRAGRLTGDRKKVFQHIREQGWDNAQFNTESLTTLKSALGRKYDKIIEYGMLTFSESERLNRAATIAAAYEGLRALKPKEDFGKLMNEALEVSNDAHGVYNRGNLPYLALGRHPAAHLFRAFYVFRTFSHTYLQNMARLGFEKKDYAAVAHMALSPAIIAGAGASVLTPLISGLLKAFGADEPEEKAYRKIGELFGGTAEETARFGLTGQIPFGLGFSTKGSLAIGIGDIPTSIKDLIGAPGSVVEDVYKGLKSVARGDVFKGAEKIAPTGIGNIVRAYREYSEGLTTGTNAPLFYGPDQVRPSLAEAFLRGFSLNPVRIAGIRERQWKEYQVKDVYRERATDIYAKIKRYVLEGSKDPGRWAEILGEIAQHNEGAAYWNLPRITGRSIKTNIKRNFKASKRERERVK